jgi:hypothetical protein
VGHPVKGVIDREGMRQVAMDAKGVKKEPSIWALEIEV